MVVSSAWAAAHLQAWFIDRVSRLHREGSRGQGTVEYVGIVVTMALLLGAVAASSKAWGGDVGNALKGVIKDAIDAAGGSVAGRR